MIRVDIDNSGFIIQGHALYASKGKDLVCAGVSAISIGVLNVFKDEEAQIILEEGLCVLSINKINEYFKSIMKLIYIQLNTLREQYPNHITINAQFMSVEEK